MLSKSVVQNDSIMSTIVDEDSHMFSWKGNNKRILVYPVDYDQQYNITCTYPSNFSSEQTSNNNSAAIVGMNILALDLFLISPMLTYFPGSI